MKNVRWIAAGLGLALVIGLVFWLDSKLVWQDSWVDNGYRDSAKRNPLHATELLLRRLGVATTSVADLTDLSERLGHGDTLVLTTPSYALGPIRTGWLLDWVAGGGHLLLAVQRENESGAGQNRLLDHFKVSTGTTGSGDYPVLKLRLTPTDKPLLAEFKGRYYLHDDNEEAYWTAGDEDGDLLVQFVWGDGLVTLINDLYLFSNPRLGDYDHAELLWGLLHLDDRTGAVWLQFIPRIPSLAQLLWEYAWMPLLALLLTLACALWSCGIRRGPLLEPHAEHSRSLLEHIRASGHFLYRRQRTAALLAAAQQRTLLRLQRHIPGWRSLERTQQIEHIVTLTGLQHAQIARALQPTARIGEREFLYTMRMLNLIGKKL